MSAFMDFINGLIGKTASGGRDRIAARVRKGEEPVKPEQTTAPREFDQFPAFYRMAGLEPPMVRGGYFGEVLDA